MTTEFKRHEEILVLFGSQTGNSEQAAETLASLIPSKISLPSVSVTSTFMQLDDFLELHRAKWTSVVVIITSSYGVGQAPLGCYKFRSLCDRINSHQGCHNMLEAVSFAMLGLGDSNYKTFFQNPTSIHKALCTAGANHVGPFGVADANGDQSNAIATWIENIIPILSDAVANIKCGDEQEKKLKVAQENTLRVCHEIFPDFKPQSDAAIGKSLGFSLQFATFVVVAAIIAMIFLI